jgi:hypothetical protein
MNAIELSTGRPNILPSGPPQRYRYTVLLQKRRKGHDTFRWRRHKGRSLDPVPRNEIHMDEEPPEKPGKLQSVHLAIV